MALKVAVIGAGPAGFYLCDRLLKKRPDLYINLFEAGNHPFGLVRYGVAPDHPEIKQCTNKFAEIGSNRRVSFYGNIRIGHDFPLEYLQRSHDFVVQCTGASRPRCLKIPGNELCITSDQFIGWINGSSESRNFNIELKNISRVAVIGNGNVALDVVRLLSKSPETLRRTDISSKALISLMQSNINQIHLIGRRGLENVSFTAKEFRETSELAMQIVTDPAAFLEAQHLSLTSKIERRIQRVTQFLVQRSSTFQNTESIKKVHFHFHSIPMTVKKVSECQKSLELLNNETSYTLFPELIITCLGYESQNGQYWSDVTYKSGWARLGAKGTLVSSLSDAQIVADAIDSAINAQQFPNKRLLSAQDYIKDKGLKSVTWRNYNKLENLEKEEGQSRGKPREKCLDNRVQLAQVGFEEDL